MNKIIRTSYALCFLVLAFLSLTAQNRTVSKTHVTNGFILNCYFNGLKDGTKVYLRTQEQDTISTAISNGEYFTFKGKLSKNGRFHFIAFDTMTTKVASNAIFIVNGVVNVQGHIGQKKVTVIGSSAQTDYNTLLNATSSVNEKRIIMSGELEKIEADIVLNAGDSSIVSELQIKRKDVFNKIQMTGDEEIQIGLKWIELNNFSLLAPYIISVYRTILGFEKMKKSYDRLTDVAKNSYYGGVLKNEIERIRLASRIQLNNILPNFSIISPEGKKLFIHDIVAESKFTLIDCWASWCKPCRAEIPSLKKIFAKYNTKGLNIVGISSDKKEIDWKKAIKEDDTPWLHGIENREMSVVSLFDLNSIPAYILVDRKGKLLAFDCSLSTIPNFGGGLRGEALEKKLEELLNKSGK